MDDKNSVDCRVIACVNQKGGVGKSVSSTNLGIGLAWRGHKVLIADLDAFPDHPFQVKLDEAMQAMADSVKAIGIQTPAVVRPKDDGRYELVSGHRRKMACEIAGLDTMPCIVREMSRDEAIIAMVDANLQREIILPSEKAKSYKMCYDAMKRQAGRPSKDNSATVLQNYEGKSSRELLAKKNRRKP